MMTAREAARAMMWVKAQGLSESKAIELINFITETLPQEEVAAEDKAKASTRTKE